MPFLPLISCLGLDFPRPCGNNPRGWFDERIFATVLELRQLYALRASLLVGLHVGPFLMAPKVLVGCYFPTTGDPRDGKEVVLWQSQL